MSIESRYYIQIESFVFYIYLTVNNRLVRGGGGFFFFFLHVLCLYATLWVITDLSLSTYKNLARLDALYVYISALSRRVYHTTFGDFPLLIQA